MQTIRNQIIHFETTPTTAITTTITTTTTTTTKENKTKNWLLFAS